MSMVIWAVAGLYMLVLLVRTVRWLALLQQKEYRLDRLWLFLKSTEGRAEVLHLLPAVSEFSRTGFKRPRLTARAIFSAVLVAIELVVLLWGVVGWSWLSFAPQALDEILLLSLWLTVIVLCVPLLVAVTAVPSSIIARVQTARMVRQAAALLAKKQPLIIGITGSYGKSSTKQLLAHVLRKKYSVFATPKSFNTRYSVAKSIVDGYSQEEIVIIEYGAYGPGEIKKLAAELRPNWAIITGFAPQHVGLFGSEEAIAQAKAELIRALPPDGKVFVNGDDKGVQRIVAAARGARPEIIEFSVAQTSVLKRAKITTNGYLELPAAAEGVVTTLIGKHYLQTLAGVWTVAAALDITERMFAQQVSTFQVTDTFVTAVESKGGVHIIDDGGTSNPRGFAAALALLAELEYPQKILITPGIVDLGAQSVAIHRRLAEQAWAAGVSEVLYVGTNGLAEFSAVFGPTRVLTEQSAIAATLSALPHGTVVLIEGRMPGWCQALLMQIQ